LGRGGKWDVRIIKEKKERGVSEEWIFISGFHIKPSKRKKLQTELTSQSQKSSHKEKPWLEKKQRQTNSPGEKPIRKCFDLRGENASPITEREKKVRK